jgi:hypothetical protein
LGCTSAHREGSLPPSPPPISFLHFRHRVHPDRGPEAHLRDRLLDPPQPRGWQSTRGTTARWTTGRAQGRPRGTFWIGPSRVPFGGEAGLPDALQLGCSPFLFLSLSHSLSLSLSHSFSLSHFVLPPPLPPHTHTTVCRFSPLQAGLRGTLHLRAQPVGVLRHPVCAAGRLHARGAGQKDPLGVGRPRGKGATPPPPFLPPYTNAPTATHPPTRPTHLPRPPPPPHSAAAGVHKGEPAISFGDESEAGGSLGSRAELSGRTSPRRPGGPRPARRHPPRPPPQARGPAAPVAAAATSRGPPALAAAARGPAALSPASARLGRQQVCGRGAGRRGVPGALALWRRAAPGWPLARAALALWRRAAAPGGLRLGGWAQSRRPAAGDARCRPGSRQGLELEWGLEALAPARAHARPTAAAASKPRVALPFKDNDDGYWRRVRQRGVNLCRSIEQRNAKCVHAWGGGPLGAGGRRGCGQATAAGRRVCGVAPGRLGHHAIRLLWRVGLPARAWHRAHRRRRVASGGRLRPVL